MKSGIYVLWCVMAPVVVLSTGGRTLLCFLGLGGGCQTSPTAPPPASKKYNPWCIYESGGQDYAGNDLHHHLVESVDACCLLCLKTDRCTHFSYFAHDGDANWPANTCVLKDYKFYGGLHSASSVVTSGYVASSGGCLNCASDY
jgi:hypothetical protein